MRSSSANAKRKEIATPVGGSSDNDIVEFNQKMKNQMIHDG